MSRPKQFTPEQHPTSTAAEDLRPKVAVSKQRQARLAKSTPEEAAMRTRYYQLVDEVYLRLSAPKRAQGHGDCSEEMAAAEREALERVRAEFPQSAPVQATNGQAPARLVGQPIRMVARPRERRAQRSSKSTSSSGSDEPGEPPPPAWRWRQPDGWLADHGDVEDRATTWRPSLRVRVLDALNPSLRRF